jgi:hypothetical protein
MDKGPKLLPETVYQVIKLVDDSQWDPTDISAFLISCVFVSKEWHAIARPLTLAFLGISFVDVQIAAERIATLHEILDVDPSYAGRVRRLKIGIYDSGEAMDCLDECGDALLLLVKRFAGLTHLLVDPSYDVCGWLCMSFEWLQELPHSAQECFTHICSLPSLKVLDLRGVELPPSIFIHHPALEHLTLAFGYDWVQGPTLLTSTYKSEIASLKSLTILLHCVMDKDEVVDVATTNTLRQILDTQPQLFRSLTSFDALSLVENIQDIRAVLNMTRGTLEHFACGLTWQRLNGPHYDRWNPPSSAEMENELKLDLGSMSRLASIELRFDTPESLGFDHIFHAILSSLKTIQWKAIGKLKLMLVADFPMQEPYNPWRVGEYCHPLDALVSLHTIASGTSPENQLDDIQMWILHRCRDDPSRTRSGEKGRAVFPLLAEQARRRTEMNLGCHIWANEWHPEHEAYLMGGWKMNAREEAEIGIRD